VFRGNGPGSTPAPDPAQHCYGQEKATKVVATGEEQQTLQFQGLREEIRSLAMASKGRED